MGINKALPYATVWRTASDGTLSKAVRFKRACIVRLHYMKFKNKQSESVLLEIRPVVVLGNGTDWEGHEGAFWDAGKDLHLNCVRWLHMGKHM